METVSITVLEKKTGLEKTGDVLLPTTLNEAAAILKEKRLIEFARQTLLARAKRQLANGARPRRRLLKISVNELSREQRLLLVQTGLLREE